jgi:hypothetical protein
VTTISFPTLSNAVPADFEFGLMSVTQTFRSPLSGAVQTLELPGARWYTRFRFPPLRATAAVNDAGLLAAFLVKLRGQARRAALWNFKRPVPLGTIQTSGVTLASGVAAEATTASFSGCGAAKTLLAGDLFSIGGELKMATADFTADGSGEMAGITFEPPMRSAVAGGEAVTLDKPTALFILDNPQVTWRSSPGDVNDFELSFTEVFA